MPISQNCWSLLAQSLVLRKGSATDSRYHRGGTGAGQKGERTTLIPADKISGQIISSPPYSQNVIKLKERTRKGIRKTTFSSPCSWCKMKTSGWQKREPEGATRNYPQNQPPFTWVFDFLRFFSGLFICRPGKAVKGSHKQVSLRFPQHPFSQPWSRRLS